MQDLFQMSIMDMDDSEEYGKSLNMADNESMLESTVEQGTLRIFLLLLSVLTALCPQSKQWSIPTNRTF